MQSDTWTVGEIFQDRLQYTVPFYQRGYAWNQERQWSHLWEDIRDKAEAQLAGGRVAPHFLGAIVVEPQQRVGLRGVSTHHIIDGQQRLTTLQFVLQAMRLAVDATDVEGLGSSLAEVLVNPNPATMRDPKIEIFKVWPTYRDREAFTAVMTADRLLDLRIRFANEFTMAGKPLKHQPYAALAAVWFFAEKAIEFIETSESGKDAAAEAMLVAVLQHLKIVEITLQDDDDAQIIFESLNGQGEPLNATDLVRNFIFMRAERDGAEASELYETMWRRFETAEWSTVEHRGRLNKPRLEWMLQSVLQAETHRDVEVSRLYAEYRAYALNGSAPRPATEQLAMLNRYADHYEALVTGQGTLPIARFGARMKPYDVTTMYPVALLISAAGLSREDTTAMFNDLVSYVVRRAVCGLTAKNYNNVFMATLRHLAREGVTPENLRAHLHSYTVENARWPGDAEFRAASLKGDVFYGRLKPASARQLLTEIEAVLRSARRTEEPELPTLQDLDVDHVMPRSWYEHWPLADGTHASEDEAKKAIDYRRNGEALSTRQMEILGRMDATPTLGNITLLHYGVNRSASNKNFATKKALIVEGTNLSLNVRLLTEDEWSVEKVRERGERLVLAALQLYPSPAAAGVVETSQG